MTDKHKTAKPLKPAAPIHQKLYKLWFCWLGYRLILYPVLVGVATKASIISGVAWQALVLLPAFLFTKAVWQGKSPYSLIMLSMITLIYLASAGVFLALRVYEQAPVLVSLGFAFEMVLLLGINVLLFVLLKRLPPMHKSWQ